MAPALFTCLQGGFHFLHFLVEHQHAVFDFYAENPGREGVFVQSVGAEYSINSWGSLDSNQAGVPLESPCVGGWMSKATAL